MSKWILDSGAPCHFANNRKYLINYKAVEKRYYKGVGSVRLKVWNGKDWGVILLHNVVYMPDSGECGVSIFRLLKKNWVAQCIDTKIYITDPKGSVAVCGEWQGNMLYIITDKRQNPTLCACPPIPKIPSFESIHTKMFKNDLDKGVGSVVMDTGSNMNNTNNPGYVFNMERVIYKINTMYGPKKATGLGTAHFLSHTDDGKWGVLSIGIQYMPSFLDVMSVNVLLSQCSVTMNKTDLVVTRNSDRRNILTAHIHDELWKLLGGFVHERFSHLLPIRSLMYNYITSYSNFEFVELDNPEPLISAVIGHGGRSVSYMGSNKIEALYQPNW